MTEASNETACWESFWPSAMRSDGVSACIDRRWYSCFSRLISAHSASFPGPSSGRARVAMCSMLRLPVAIRGEAVLAAASFSLSGHLLGWERDEAETGAEGGRSPREYEGA